jgi:hypothetical protein
MGKRELLLIAAFAIMGVMVYQFTAPPPAPGERSFSPGQIIENFRRGIRGNRASAESVNTTAVPVDPAVTDLNLTWTKGSPSEVSVLGEERDDISAEISVRSRAYDDAEAERTAKATVLKTDRGGTRVTAWIDFPREGAQTATLTLHVPARLQMRVDAARSRTRVTNIAALELASGRGESEFRQIKGRVAGNYRGGELRVIDAQSVKFTTVGTDVRLERISGETSLNMRAGDLKAAELRGPLDFDGTGVDVEIDKLEKTSGMARITATAGSVSLRGLATEARLDARNADVDVIVDRAVPLAIYSDGGSPVEITPPPGGYRLDAVASDGSIEVPEGTVEVTTNGTEHRASGSVNGGGPMITIRASHGSITLRAREEAEKH